MAYRKKPSNKGESQRVKSAFDWGRMTTERAIIREYISCAKLPTDVPQLGEPSIVNLVPEERLGKYRSPSARKLLSPDSEVYEELLAVSKPIPSFLEAGPRKLLYHDPQPVRAAIVTTGGVAPGLNSVVHSIVNRHWNTYSINRSRRGEVFGVSEGFKGLSARPLAKETLDPTITKSWLDLGGSMLGCVRFESSNYAGLAEDIAANLRSNQINILYVIGGDGSMRMTHQIASAAPAVSVVGIPKTMDNDVLWVWQSFGFNTAVEKATEVVNTMHAEAVSTRRVCIIELFGAKSGFVAANATLASGHVDLVLVPEDFEFLEHGKEMDALSELINHVFRVVLDKERPHAIIVIAEGVGKLFEERKVELGGSVVIKDGFAAQLAKYLEGKVKDTTGTAIGVLLNQPKHNIRAIPANAHDRIYCERLGALAVDNALAGYTDFMISQWLTEYVLVPLELVTAGERQKSIPPQGMFWKQVVASTGQPVVGPNRTPTPSGRPLRRSEVSSRKRRSARRK